MKDLTGKTYVIDGTEYRVTIQSPGLIQTKIMSSPAAVEGVAFTVLESSNGKVAERYMCLEDGCGFSSMNSAQSVASHRGKIHTAKKITPPPSRNLTPAETAANAVIRRHSDTEVTEFSGLVKMLNDAEHLAARLVIMATELSDTVADLREDVEKLNPEESAENERKARAYDQMSAMFRGE